MKTETDKQNSFSCKLPPGAVLYDKDKPVINESKTEHGRYQLSDSNKLVPGALVLHLENIYREKDFWLNIVDEKKDKLLGHIKFVKISPNMFVLADIRPFCCPIQHEPSICKPCEEHQGK